MNELYLSVNGWLEERAGELGVGEALWLPISAVALLAFFILIIRSIARRRSPKGLSGQIDSVQLSRTAELPPETASALLVEEEVVVSMPSAPPTETRREPTIEPPIEPPTEHQMFSTGLAKTRESFLGRFLNLVKGRESGDAKLYEDLEELLITSDIGFKTSQKLLTAARETLKTQGSTPTEESLIEILFQEIRGILLDDGAIELPAERTTSGPTVILVVGVNGAGKTTTIGKLAHRFITNNKKVLLAAADTFRAGAVEQLEVWAGRSGVEFHRSAEGAKPSTVAYEAIHRGLAGDYDVVIIDTAGRLHTRVNLMNELGSVVNIISREQPGAPHETILVVDGTSGQNALEQAREFNAKAKLSGVIVTKLDGTPKGGIVIAIKDEIGVPIRYVGLGEKIDALRPFSADEFTAGLFGR